MGLLLHYCMKLKLDFKILFTAVSYIFTLQQQVVDIQFHLVLLEQLLFANSYVNPLNIQNWFHPETNSNLYYDNESFLVDDLNPI